MLKLLRAATLNMSCECFTLGDNLFQLYSSRYYCQNDTSLHTLCHTKSPWRKTTVLLASD